MLTILADFQFVSLVRNAASSVKWGMRTKVAYMFVVALMRMRIQESETCCATSDPRLLWQSARLHTSYRYLYN